MSPGEISKKTRRKKEGQRRHAVAPLSLVPIKIGVNRLVVSTPLEKLTPADAESGSIGQRNSRFGRGIRHGLADQAIDDAVRVPTGIITEVCVNHCHLWALMTKA